MFGKPVIVVKWVMRRNHLYDMHPEDYYVLFLVVLQAHTA